MHPDKVERSCTNKLTDLPNVGPAMARDLALIGIRGPDQLRDRDPWELYELLCARTRTRQDPCVLDTFMSITDYMGGGEPRPWWAYTQERKRRYGPALARGRHR